MRPITEEQRQALIYDCEQEIKLIERDLASYRGNPALMSELIRQQIALASLTAKHRGYIDAGTPSDEINILTENKILKTDIALYTEPPVSEMQAVEKPSTKCIGWVKEALKDHDDKWISAIRAAGYDVK